jgi:hypothetical protein
MSPHPLAALPLVDVAAGAAARLVIASPPSPSTVPSPFPPSPSTCARAAARAARFLLSSRYRRDFRYLASLLRFRNAGDPRALLRSVVGGGEAALLDPALGLRARLRLAGDFPTWPPRLVFRIVANTPVCDVNSFAPRAYADDRARGGGGGRPSSSSTPLPHDLRALLLLRPASSSSQEVESGVSLGVRVGKRWVGIVAAHAHGGDEAAAGAGASSSSTCGSPVPRPPAAVVPRRPVSSPDTVPPSPLPLPLAALSPLLPASWYTRDDLVLNPWRPLDTGIFAQSGRPPRPRTLSRATDADSSAPSSSLRAAARAAAERGQAARARWSRVQLYLKPPNEATRGAATSDGGDPGGRPPSSSSPPPSPSSSLLRWAADLDFDTYVRDWHAVASTSVRVPMTGAV